MITIDKAQTGWLPEIMLKSKRLLAGQTATSPILNPDWEALYLVRNTRVRQNKQKRTIEKPGKIQMPKKTNPEEKAAERELKRQMVKAEKQAKAERAKEELRWQLSKAVWLAENEEFDETLEILIPLAIKLPRNPELLRVLGISYIGVGLFEEASDALEESVSLAGKATDPLQRFQLATTYALTGYPVLALYQLQQITNFAELTRGWQKATEVNEFRKGIQKIVDKLAEANGMNRAAFLKFAMPIERGQLALRRGEANKAGGYFLKVIENNRRAAIGWLKRAAALEADWALGLAVGECYQYHVLGQIDPENRVAYGHIIRLLIAMGHIAEAQAELKKLEGLPITDDPANMLCLAEAYARFDEDNKVYDLLKPLAEKYNRDSEELIEAEYNQLKTLLAIAAIHLEKKAEAKLYLEDVVNNSEDELARRTLVALEKEEESPRPNQRFYYFSPTVYYQTVTIALNGRIDNLIKGYEKSLGQFMRSWYRNFREPAFEVLRFAIWVSEGPTMREKLVDESVKIGVPQSIELAREIAFGRAFSDMQRLGAAAALVEGEQIMPDEEITIWLNHEARTGTVKQLTRAFNAALKTAQDDDDDEDDDDD